MNEDQKNNLKAIGIIIVLCLAFYIIIFISWNNSPNAEHKPTFYFWDNHKEGYVKDPLVDKYKGN